jgi:hypothetical protein
VIVFVVVIGVVVMVVIPVVTVSVNGVCVSVVRVNGIVEFSVATCVVSVFVLIFDRGSISILNTLCAILDMLI